MKSASKAHRGSDRTEQQRKNNWHAEKIILFPDKKQVYKNEKGKLFLTAREYQLLEYLMYNQGNVLTKRKISWNMYGGLDGQFCSG